MARYGATLRGKQAAEVRGVEEDKVQGCPDTVVMSKFASSVWRWDTSVPV